MIADGTRCEPMRGVQDYSCTGACNLLQILWVGVIITAANIADIASVRWIAYRLCHALHRDE